MGIGPEKNREVLPAPVLFCPRTPDLLCHPERLFLVPRQGHESHFLPTPDGGPQGLLMTGWAVMDQGIGHPQDGLRTPVIVFQSHHLRIGKEVSKLQDVADLGTSPSIDTLVVIPHHTDIMGRPDQLHEQIHLQSVGVLELIHRHVSVAVPPVITGLLEFP